MDSISNILSGWRNHLFPKETMKELITLVHEERMAICNVCPKNSKVIDPKVLFATCTSCGCPLVTKTKALTVSCPENKWAAILTPEEKGAYEEQIKSKNQDAQEGTK